MNTLVMGIGNTFLQDGGAGVYAAHYLQNMQPSNPDINYIDAGDLDSFPLNSPIHSSDNLVVIDAADLHDSPGAVAVFTGYDMDIFVTGRSNCSSYEAGLANLLKTTRMTDNLPNNRALISIQPKTIAWGNTLTDEILASVPLACKKVMQLIVKWQQ